MRRPFTIGAFALVLALVVAACGGGTTETTAAPATTAAPKPFRVALVAPSAINDLAFTQSMYDALISIQSDMGGESAMEIAVTDSTFVVEDAAAAIRDYASSGYDLVIAHGSQYGGSLKEIAPDFPDTSFAWGTAGDTFGLPNVFAYEAASEEGGYVMGVMGAALSKSGVLGVVGPIEVGDAKRYVDGFAAGATAQDPNADVKINYTGSFSDVALAAEAARAEIGAGADVLTGTAQMVVGAIGVAKDDGVPWFGTQADQTQLAPSFVVASQVYHWEVVMKEIIDLMGQGTIGGKSFTIDLANGGEVISYNPGYALPTDVKQLAEDTVKGISDGSINPPRP
ncbi:MAG TPA: BMP family ABC transporter substrate-binding protein [Actinobacteria bacterium]|nr:BMP family ABC transporter substrate-binding protein [Actinomycetota bacterium]